MSTNNEQEQAAPVQEEFNPKGYPTQRFTARPQKGAAERIANIVFPSSLKEKVDFWGEEICNNMISRSVAIQLQDDMRKSESWTAKDQDSFKTWKPYIGRRTDPVAKVQAVKKNVADTAKALGLTIEELMALLKDGQK